MTEHNVTDNEKEKQVCVEPPPSALNMTLPAFAAERRRLHCSMAPGLAQGAQQESRLPPLLLSIDGTDRQTDRQTDSPVRK